MGRWTSLCSDCLVAWLRAWLAASRLLQGSLMALTGQSVISSDSQFPTELCTAGHPADPPQNPLGLHPPILPHPHPCTPAATRENRAGPGQSLLTFPQRGGLPGASNGRCGGSASLGPLPRLGEGGRAWVAPRTPRLLTDTMGAVCLGLRSRVLPGTQSAGCLAGATLTPATVSQLPGPWGQRAWGWGILAQGKPPLPASPLSLCHHPWPGPGASVSPVWVFGRITPEFPLNPGPLLPLPSSQQGCGLSIWGVCDFCSACSHHQV